MPVAQKGSGQGRQALLVLLGAVVGVGAIMFLILRQGSLIADTGGETFGAGGVATLGQAEELAELADSGPIFLPDVASRDRDIYLQHLSEDSTKGWLAFAARPLAASRDCTLEWDQDESDFVDPCDGARFDEAGSGLAQYPVTVDADGLLSVDINALDRATSTTVSG